MSNITTPDDLLRLAPDALSIEKARRLFFSRRWQSLGGDGQWIWGEYQYAPYQKPIQAAVDLQRGRFLCNCRTRQRPCPHGLALVLYLKNDAEKIHIEEPPSWVRQLKNKLQSVVIPPRDKAAANDRLEKRLALMQSGVEELEVRLYDFVGRGLAEVISQGAEVWLAGAARLQDAKLPGPASALRRLASLPPEQIESAAARILGDLYLFIKAWKKRDDLPTGHQEELMRYAGLPVSKEDLMQQPATQDHWLVMGVKEEQIDRLRHRRSWLRGEASGRFVLILDFAFGDQAFERSWPLMASFTGGVYFYPGAYAQRAIFPNPITGGRAYENLKGYQLFKNLLKNYRKALALNPWLMSYPAYLQSVIPVMKDDTMSLVDSQNMSIPLSGDSAPAMELLLAVSGGQGISVFVEFDGYYFYPLSVFGLDGFIDCTRSRKDISFF